ncbi:hypothetical protein EVAR_84231_1 [Eumeta japonica]|uniref:Uncharacterized protein n=1 Tax=Eumeta variegata TaxID=151549 RepID=A0A4C1WQU7_EUMVA|nr:hypothetical protein EVAR_84231_1 [Eumeta japonica]
MSNAVHADAPRAGRGPRRSQDALRAAGRGVMDSDGFGKTMGSQLSRRLAGKDILNICYQFVFNFNMYQVASSFSKGYCEPLC